MFALTIRTVIAQWRRLLSSAFAVVLGVAFMAGTFVFSDTLSATMNRLVQASNENVDALVRAPEPIDLDFADAGVTIDSALVEEVRSLPEVAEADLQIIGYAQLIGPDGEPVVDRSTSETLGYNWSSSDALNPYDIVDGRDPERDDEIVIDRASAKESGYVVGDTATVLTARDAGLFRVVGVASYGDADSLGGAGAVLFTSYTAERLLTEPGQTNGIAAVAADGVTQEQLVTTLETELTSRSEGPLEVITGKQISDDNRASIATLTAPFKTFLLVFALIAMFVSAFIINNTFSITVNQRARDMALLRALGATRRQVTTTVIVEAAMTGVLASAAGLALGLGVARLLRALMSALDFQLPPGSTVVSPDSMLVAFGLGVAATVLSAIAPSRTAGRVAPIAALRGLSLEVVRATRRRLTFGAVTVVGGVASLLIGLATRAVAVVGLGSVATLVGIATLGPVLVRPAARVLGVPFSIVGVSGELAVQNAIRNPRRTARTASSLMIGVGLVAFMAVFGASMTSSFGSSMNKNFFGTHVVESGGGFSPEVADAMRVTEGIDVVSEFRLASAQVNGDDETTDLEAYDPATIGELIDLGDIDGDLNSLGTDGIAIERDYAQRNELEVGDQIPVVLRSGPITATVRAIYDETVWVGSQFMSTAAFDKHLPRGLVYRVYAVGDADAIRSIAERFPTADVLDRDAFLDTVSSTIEQFLAVITALLALTVVIALLGVANTLSLAIFERSHEIGLLRAIGMDRRQLRATVRNEATIVALLGTLLGISVGTFFGWAVVRTLEDQGFDQLTVPGATLLLIAAIGAAAGAMVATWPARRAARLDVLNALAKT